MLALLLSRHAKSAQTEHLRARMTTPVLRYMFMMFTSRALGAKVAGAATMHQLTTLINENGFLSEIPEWRRCFRNIGPWWVCDILAHAGGKARCMKHHVFLFPNWSGGQLVALTFSALTRCVGPGIRDEGAEASFALRARLGAPFATWVHALKTRSNADSRNSTKTNHPIGNQTAEFVGGAQQRLTSKAREWKRLRA